jgi:ribosomal protein S27E
MDAIQTGLAHASWGAPHCPGYLSVIVRGERVEVSCEECGTLSWTLPATDLDQTISRMKNTRPTMLPHSEFGDPECCGCLNGYIRGAVADVECNECGSLIRTVPTAELERTLTEMELTLDSA